MANNTYVNKVIYGDQSLIDLSSDTAVASDVASGKYFHLATGERVAGTYSAGNNAVSVVDAQDTNGGTIRTITAVSLAGDTVTAEHLESGYTAHDASGTAITGSLTAGGGGSGSVERKDVNFYDYDGTIVASYTTAEFADISALPSNPSHTGLTAQGWNIPSNWTLANAKTYVATNKKADWGQMYTTTSGVTEIDVEFADPNRLSPNMSLAVNGTVSIDWGDGSTASTVTGSSLTTRKNTGAHTYPAVGKYTIKISASSGNWGFYGTSSYFLLYKTSVTNNNQNRVYSNCIKTIRIGAGCTSIGDHAFYNCNSLVSVTIPNSVTSIGTNTFYGCFSLVSVTIPSSVTSIGTYTFYTCYSLVSVAIPSSVTSIGDYTFYACYSLASVTIPNSVTSISNNMFYNCFSLVSVTIPSSVTSIGNSAFYCCYILTGVTIPSNVTSIGNSAFYACYTLTSVPIPSNVTSIGSNTFYNCYILTSVTIPSNVTSIGSKAFYSCHGLSSIHFKGTTPPTVAASDAFSSIPSDCKIYVPTDKLSAYTTASNYPSSNTYTYVEE